MLYQKKSEKTLSNELFQNPTSEFRGAPFWAWNTRLSDKTLLKQIDIFKEMGLGGFHMHVRTGMETTYLSDEFMHFIKLCNEKAKKEKMLCWLYDEDRWPSGAAGGYVTKNYRYRQRCIIMQKKDPRPEAAENLMEFNRRADAGEEPLGYFVARYGIRLDDEGYLIDYKRLADGEAFAGEVRYAYMHIARNSGWYNGQAYLDTLNNTAVQAFIDTTYEAYAREVGEDFGKSIPAIFTDEPQVFRHTYLPTSDSEADAQIAFTDDFDDTYIARFGESLLDKLPELFWEKRDNGCAFTRWSYMDHLSERFVSAFADTIGAWCERHGIAFTGHMMEEPTLRSQTNALGEAMRCYRSFQIPGMDLLCDNVELTTAKQVQSCVHQYGREGMLSELYGVTGWDFPFSGHKRQGDWQAALGVTVRVHHLTWVSMNGDAKHDYPASIGYQSPWYKEYRVIEDHFARVNTALTRGTPVVRVGVIHPIESFWLLTGPNDKTALRRAYLDEQFSALTDALCTGGVDFDFISESLFPSLCEKAENPLKVGKMQYDCVVVPVMDTMRATTLTRLRDFAAAGGTVILIGRAAGRVDAVPSDKVSRASENWTRLDVDYNALIDALEPYRFVNFLHEQTGTRCGNLVHQLRRDGNDFWLFFCHAHDNARKENFTPAHESDPVRVVLNGAFDVTEYDTMTGNVYTPAYRIHSGKTEIRHNLFTEDSLLLKLSPAENADKTVEGDAPVRAMPRNAIDVAHPGAARTGKTILAEDRVRYTLDEPNAVLLDTAQYAFDGDAYGEETDSARIGDLGRKLFYKDYLSQNTVQPWVPVPEKLKNDPGHTVRRRFRFFSEIPLSGARLALEMADEARIFVNGREIEKIFDGAHPWYVDECIRRVLLPDIPAGEVVIEIETPFTLRGRTEWCYVLGDFGVRVDGRFVTVIPRPETLAFGDAVHQGFPFYTGNITYHSAFEEPEAGAPRTLQVSDFGGALVRARVDGRDLAPLVISPYCADLGTMSRGTHTLDLTVYGTRFNGFGPVHNNVRQYRYWGPNAWKTYDSPMWSDPYRLRPTGILNTPVIY